MKKIGVWLIGAFGSISVTVMLGALLIRKGLSPMTGMITANEPFSELGLLPIEAMEFGGCDIRSGQITELANDAIKKIGGIDASILRLIDVELEQIQGRICQGTSFNCGKAIEGLSSTVSASRDHVREEIGEIVRQINHFKDSNDLDKVIIVNLASTEPPLELTDVHHDPTALEHCLDKNKTNSLRGSTIYSYAAIISGCPYINFTPSNGALFPSLVKLAESKGIPVMGNDGKTGETLVKSALAPMFKYRSLEILSWEGFNILGNMDGHILDCEENRESKIRSKDSVLGKILGYSPHSQVHINYVPSLDDRKTAWDFIHFKGFLDTKMSLQFVWEGYDSILAAPLVLDLVRFAEFAHRRGESGLMPHLASYFKDPIGAEEHSLHEQFRLLLDYAGDWAKKRMKG
ncbi:MAG: inositol-3-phosphate synthase [Desulfomonilaceae bacterium]